MGQMALGYGSEFHLLRWLGRHRNEFDNRVKGLIQVDNISWLDFDFDENNPIPDKELKGLSFLDPNIYSKILTTWHNEWPQSGNSMNWDLIGYSEDQRERKWILIEAKAHIGELSQSCKAKSSVSRTKIKTALSNTAQNYGITSNDYWIENYYQLANRIYILDLLKRFDIKARLINIYFCGDLVSQHRDSPQNEAKWRIPISTMKNLLGINTEKQKEIGIYDLFLDVAK